MKVKKQVVCIERMQGRYVANMKAVLGPDASPQSPRAVNLHDHGRCRPGYHTVQGDSGIIARGAPREPVTTVCTTDQLVRALEAIAKIAAKPTDETGAYPDDHPNISDLALARIGVIADGVLAGGVQ